MSIEEKKLKNVLEAAMMSVAKPMSIEQMMKLFDDEERPSANKVKSALQSLQQDCEGRGIELKDVASGYRYQARQDYSEWISRLWEEKPAKYSRAYLETLALIAYRQPVTRGEIEEVRGVGVSSSIIKTMLEREWIRVVGHRDVPGRPSLYATTKQFLDYFDMKSLDELPSLAEIKDLDELNPELGLNEPGQVDEEENSDKDNSEVQDNDADDSLDETRDTEIESDADKEPVIELEDNQPQNESAEDSGGEVEAEVDSEIEAKIEAAPQLDDDTETLEETETEFAGEMIEDYLTQTSSTDETTG